MSKMKNFAAFRALVQLLEENNMEGELEKVYYKCKAQEELPIEEMKNESELFHQRWLFVFLEYLSLHRVEHKLQRQMCRYS